MRNCVITFPSYTYAIKAFKLLRARNIECRIVRSGHSSEEGCGYSLEAYGNCGEIRKILDDYAVPYNSLRNEVFL